MVKQQIHTIKKVKHGNVLAFLLEQLLKWFIDLICTFNDLIKRMLCYLQKVQADQGNHAHHAVLADQRYRADQPNPEDLKDPEDPESGEKRWETQLMFDKCLNRLIIWYYLIIVVFFFPFLYV